MSQGKVKKIIEGIIQIRSKGSSACAGSIKAMLALKGFNLDKFTAATPDSQADIDKLFKVAEEMKVDVAALKKLI